jgi:hypothetical protein
MSGWDPRTGGSDGPPEQPPWGPPPGGPPPGGPPPGDPGLGQTQNPFSAQNPFPAQPSGSGRPRRRRSRARIWIAAGTGVLVVVAAVVIIAVVAHNKPASAPYPGLANAAQLRELLPKSQALPPGWRVTYEPSESTSYVQPGKQPPLPINACYDFNTGFDLGVAGDTFVSLASETVQNGNGNGSGFMRIDLFSVLPGDAAAAISAVNGDVGQCSSYTDGGRSFTVTAAPVPGLGDGSLDVHVDQQGSGGILGITDNNTLLVRVHNNLIAIECLAAPHAIPSLASIAAPLVKKLPSADSLAVTAVAAPVKRKHKPAPKLSPDLTDGQLEALLPIHSGLPASYYKLDGSPFYSDQTSGPTYPLKKPPSALSCDKLPDLDGLGFTSFDFNFLNTATLSASNADSEDVDITLDEPSTVALANEDFSAFQADAAKCKKLTWVQTTYKTTVTSVPGLGDQNVNIYMRPVSSTSDFGPGGAQDLLLVRVGSALVLVDYDLSEPSQHGPSLVKIASVLVKKLE